ncbi:exosome complex exonuclease RRP46-like [Citrus sinensis]|uniref:Exosome complex exonuclease RRP46-like n=1 Tax=Citrus sinensis TaxID=2711 RepID=A0ACB8NNK4_CITSI|nr:exosome complex exonuclease RRP46-like [Citrus sinensis]
MEVDRADGRNPNQLRPLACSCSILHRAHGSASWSQGDTKVLAAVYGPKAGTKKNENPEKASIEVIWKPRTGQIACAALVDAGIPMKHLAVAICCCSAESGYCILDPTKLEEQKMKGFAYLVFPNSILSVLPEGSSLVQGEPMEHGIITSVTHGAMSVDDYFHCLERGRAASAKLSDFLRRSLQSKLPGDLSKAE